MTVQDGVLEAVDPAADLAGCRVVEVPVGIGKRIWQFVRGLFLPSGAPSWPFLNTESRKRIQRAITSAEQGSAGEICVHVASRISRRGLEADAKELFYRLELHRTPERQAVLVYLVPARRKLFVFGDEGIHQKCQGALWPLLVDELVKGFKTEAPLDALEKVIGRLGEAQRQWFPLKEGQRTNRLPDEPSEG